jgi:putative SOS response-associated peptidase YedK
MSSAPWTKKEGKVSFVCNLYSIIKSQDAIRDFTKAVRDITGNLPPMPGVFPDYMAPVVRNAPDGVRELAKLRWGMPSSQFALLEAAKKRSLRIFDGRSE